MHSWLIPFSASHQSKVPNCVVQYGLIVDLPFRITNCRFLLAIAFRT